MTDHQAPTPDLEAIDSKSSIFDKTDPDLRRRIDQAIVDRQPPTYKAVFDQFDLAARGVSFTAFYYYARRIRVNAALLELARVALPDSASAHDLLPDVLSHRLLEAAIDEACSPGTIQRLADAYRVASQTHFARRRLAAQLDDLKRKESMKENNRLLAIGRQYIKAQDNEMRARALAVKHALAQSAAAAPDEQSRDRLPFTSPSDVKDEGALANQS